jgi:hypothetical protein
MVDNPSMIAVIPKLASHAYGPLLGLSAFGMMTTRRRHDRLVPVVTVCAPILCALPGSYRLGLVSRRATAGPAVAAA